MTFYSGYEEIIIPCIERKGLGFELWHDEIQWEELYRAEKRFFKYRWINSDQERNAWKVRKDAFDRCRNMMNKYVSPPLIIGEEQTVILKDDTLYAPKSMFDHAGKVLKTSYHIIVTDELATNIYSQYDKSKIVVIESPNNISAAKEFYIKAKNTPQEVLQSLFENGAKKYSSLGLNGFCFGTFEHGGLTLDKAGMNSLTCIEEALGLAMAICESNQDLISNEQIWYLSIDSNRQTVSISKRNFNI